jgi:hypothetical protein
MEIDLNDAQAVARAVGRHFWAHQPGGVGIELGLPDGRRLDVVVVDPYGVIRAAEVKVDRSDLFRDTKWWGYGAFCDFLYLATPVGLIDQAEADRARGYGTARPGWMEVSEKGGVSIRRRVTRNHVVTFEKRCAMILRMAIRAGDPNFCPYCGRTENRMKDEP